VWTLPRTADSARQAKAAQVLKCIISDKTQLSLAENRGVVPANTALDKEYLKVFPKLSAYVDTVNGGRSRVALLGDKWPKVQTALATAIQSAITGQASVKDALSTAAAAAQ
jgi:multiple sugar transport system substrate-binding protein